MSWPWTERTRKLDRLAREVAQATGETETEAAKVALRDRLARVRPMAPARVVDEAERKRRSEVLMELGRRFRALPVLDPRTPDEILGYDENGLPT